MTATLFQIGLFPWIMIVSSLIFITDEEWQRLFNYFKIPTSAAPLITKSTTAVSNSLIGFFGIHFLIQLALPLRPFFYDENNRWTERHYRFAWNVMLVEKSGSTIFRIKEHDTGRTWTAYPKDYLTITQEKQMSFQADMIWQFSRFLQAVYKEKGISNFSIYVDCWVSFNGSLSKLYLPRNLDLLSVSEDEIYDYVIRE